MIRVRYLLLTLVWTSVIEGTHLFAQEESSWPSFSLLRAEEDYASLRGVDRQGLLEQLKYVPLGACDRSFLSVGGEVRYQYEFFHNNEFGEAIVDNSGWMLQRYMAHVGVTLGNFRVFGELKSGFQSFAKVPPRSVDEDHLDLHQLFVEYTFGSAESSSLKMRIGRQELWYGSRRLVSPRVGPNIRHSFDVARLMFNRKAVTVDAFFANYVSTEPGVFDNNRLTDERLYGLYTVLAPKNWPLSLDVYYLGFESPSRVYDEGVDEERRHSIGARLWRQSSMFRFNSELVYQFGKFGSGDIRAYTASLDLQCFLPGLLKPRIGLKTEVISGDKVNGDDRLQTFNALYPNGGYFGLIALIGPSNLLDFHPYFGLTLVEGLDFVMDWDIFWRDQREDGVYGPNASLSRSGLESNERYLGHQPGFEIGYECNRYLSFSAEASWFLAGDFFKQTGHGDDVTHFLVATQFIF